MSTITINNPTVALVNATPLVNDPLVINGSGDVSVSTPTFKNDGNVPATLNWSVTNVMNGTFTSTGVDTGSVAYKGATGSQLVQPNATVKLIFFFKVPVGQPGVENQPCTADYSVQWQ